ncbi:unnamed protein product, partial [Cyprideis torosa]
MRLLEARINGLEKDLSAVRSTSEEATQLLERQNEELKELRAKNEERRTKNEEDEDTEAAGLKTFKTSSQVKRSPSPQRPTPSPPPPNKKPKILALVPYKLEEDDEDDENEEGDQRASSVLAADVATKNQSLSSDQDVRRIVRATELISASEFYAKVVSRTCPDVEKADDMFRLFHSLIPAFSFGSLAPSASKTELQDRIRGMRNLVVALVAGMRNGANVEDVESEMKPMDREIQATGLLSGDEPSKKRSKLVLPAPQISDQELEQVVKLGRASEAAREAVTEGGEERPSDALLADYAMTGTPGQTPLMRTPMPEGNRLMQEAQNLIALSNTETPPLKGGINTPLNQMDFKGLTPDVRPLTTPNMALTTPLRTPSGTVLTTPGRAVTADSQTPLRDKLSINPEESLAGTPAAAVHASLREGLASLPAPKNDYEIVVPEEEEEASVVEDQADVEARREEAERKRMEEEMKRRSQAVQRALPRPAEINHGILRVQHPDQPLSSLQRAEELIKQEMLTMLHYDALNTPSFSGGQGGGVKKGSKEEQRHVAFLEKRPYQKFSEQELQQAQELLEKEMQVSTGTPGEGAQELLEKEMQVSTGTPGEGDA